MGPQLWSYRVTVWLTSAADRDRGVLSREPTYAEVSPINAAVAFERSPVQNPLDDTRKKSGPVKV